MLASFAPTSPLQLKFGCTTPTSTLLATPWPSKFIALSRLLATTFGLLSLIPSTLVITTLRLLNNQPDLIASPFQALSSTVAPPRLSVTVTAKALPCMAFLVVGSLATNFSASRLSSMSGSSLAATSRSILAQTTLQLSQASWTTG